MLQFSEKVEVFCNNFIKKTPFSPPATLDCSGGCFWPPPSMLIVNYIYSSSIVDNVMHLIPLILTFIT